MRRRLPLLTFPLALVAGCVGGPEKEPEAPGDSAEPEVNDTGSGVETDPCDGNPDCAGALLWALQFGDDDDQAGGRVSTHEDGSIALNGEFRGAMDLGLGVLQSNGDHDSFWAQLDADGTASHAISMGTPAYDLNTFATGPGGVVTLIGTFEGALQLGDHTLVSAGEADIVLAAFDPDEGFLWSQRYGDELRQHGGELLVDETGEITISGYIDGGTVDFGGGPLTVDEAMCGNFLARFNAQGEHQWSRVFEGVDSLWGATIALMDDGGIALAGAVVGTVNLGGEDLIGGDDTDVVVARFDADGQHQWSRRYGDSANSAPWQIVIDPTGGLLVMGFANGTIDFGGGPLGPIGVQDIFLAHLGGDGEHIWSRRFGGSDMAEGFDLAVDPGGNIVLGGWFDGLLDMGCAPLNTAGGFDGFVARLDETGGCIWSQSLGDEGMQWVAGVAAQASGNVLLTGAFEGVMEVGETTLSSVGGQDGFLLKLSP